MNGLIPWDWISYIDKEPEVVDSMKSIAIMNILKIAGNTSTPYSKLKKGYALHKKILLKQINAYNPDIIIGGNTIWNFYDDLQLKEGECNDGNYEHTFWLKDGKVYINCSHPSTTNLSDKKIETYVDGITEIVKLWRSRKN